ncbi:MAG: diacylglycerol kinase family lipid kinase [Intrasporangium sp.]|uniref:diacylglycerol/lipid kinase family protein n=1 Tax=Intrasporangium sp. TaxID=1925024 RepID=UPI002648CF8A|nr:diacylglycerol kinase family protein [Intrasporangium sp.]MDN5796886.1 diacylglycerol kinase family lipid kinase [Intrasporangium sp.]
MLSEWLPWIVVGGVVILGTTAAVLLGGAAPPPLSGKGVRRRRPRHDQFRPDDPPEQPVRHAAIVLNPTKVPGASDLRGEVRRICNAEGWGEPRFYETTVEDPGAGQARLAAADGAAVVCSFGGDGTVRSVASALIGTQTPLGVLPAGTGNLLARNLDVPVGSLDAAVRVALSGRDRRIDVGELVLGSTESPATAPGRSSADEPGTRPGSESEPAESEPAEPQRHHFLVMTGIGMDAAIMQGTNENLKATVGWGAYVVSGIKHLVSPEFRATFWLDADPGFRRRARAVIVGNCGRLLGGLVLMPDARVDDGRLDVVIASPKGFVGWAPVIARAVTRRRKGHPTLDHEVCGQIRVHTDRPLPVQIDGDVVAESSDITARVLPASLTVRVAHNS